jgi:hypothetical protein
MWPGIPVIPVMSAGAIDAKYVPTWVIPAYGTSGIFNDVNDIRAHGKGRAAAGAVPL